MTTVIWRTSTKLINIPLHPEFAEEQTKFNEGRKELMNSICCSKDLILTHINSKRVAKNMNKVYLKFKFADFISSLHRLVDLEKIKSCVNLIAGKTFSQSDT